MKRVMLRSALLLTGVVLIVLGAVAQVAWVGLCFGTVIVGIAMLIFAPRMLILPFNFIITPGFLMAIGGYFALKDSQERASDHTVDMGYFDEQAAQFADEQRIERQKKLAMLKADLEKIEENK